VEIICLNLSYHSSIVNEYERFLGKDKNDFLLENEILDLYEKYKKIKEGGVKWNI